MSWNTRLEVRLGTALISPIDAFTPTFNTPHTVIHSIETDNVGYVRQPATFTFVMTIRAIGTAVADLTQLALNGTEFDVTVAEGSGTDWAFKSIAFSGCIITSANPSNVVIDGAPAATFNCSARTMTATRN
jgi:hypothetical protein